MVSMLVLSVEGCGFNGWMGQTKDIKIGVYCFFAKHTALKSKTGCPRVTIMCLSKVAYIPADCCDNLKKSKNQMSIVWETILCRHTLSVHVD